MRTLSDEVHHRTICPIFVSDDCSIVFIELHHLTLYSTAQIIYANSPLSLRSENEFPYGKFIGRSRRIENSCEFLGAIRDLEEVATCFHEATQNRGVGA